MFALLCDAQSAFDVVPIPQIIRCAYLAGTQDQGLAFLNGRLKNRRNFLEWNDEVVGPILDNRGVEQG